MKQDVKLKTAILVLSILLILSLLALGGVLIYRAMMDGRPATELVPDNYIKPDADSKTLSDANIYSPAGKAAEYVKKSGESGVGKREGSAAVSADTTAAVSSDVKKKSAVISLYQNHADDNQPYQVGNMFPGDAETRYYCVKISHGDDVTVQYRADIRPGYEKLAEVLKCRVSLLTTGDVLYDGLMRDMPESLSYSIETDKDTESELYYEITVYLDTSVGNEYQNRDLIADFRWWVQETGSLIPPQTGDTANMWIYISVAACSVLAILLLWKGRRREEQTNG